jgi:flavodoxin/NAD-dependent dihydropyrimidine dehydrogenase PreA subunit
MKSIIIYFSLTGNTEVIAKAIKAGVEKAAGYCTLAKLKDADPYHLYNFNLIGLGTPVHAHVEPANVRAFINKMRFVGNKHIFVFSTHGTHPDFFFPSIIPKLKRRGLVVIGTFDCYAPCYLSIKPEPYPTAGHPDKIDLQNADYFGSQMVENSIRIKAGEKNLVPPIPSPPDADIVRSSKELLRELEKDAPRLNNQFAALVKFHREKCSYPKCRLCMDNCPLHGIDLSLKPPIIAQPCMNCTFCAKICPTGAIDESAWVNVSGVRMNELMQKYYLPDLHRAEKMGRFRRLVAIKDIGWNTPIYKTHNTHPQWIIGKGFK